MTERYYPPPSSRLMMLFKDGQVVDLGLNIHQAERLGEEVFAVWPDQPNEIAAADGGLVIERHDVSRQPLTGYDCDEFRDLGF
jgi:hypothetical protein